MNDEKRNPHLEMLLMVRVIGESGGVTSRRLCADGGLSVATLNRYIATARHMGARIVSARYGKGTYYTLDNWPEVRVIVEKWIDLEERRDLVELRP